MLYAEVADSKRVVIKLAVIDVVLSSLDVTAEKFLFTVTVGSHFKLRKY